MGLLDLLRRLFTPQPTPGPVGAQPRAGGEGGKLTSERAAAWLEALESGALTPPRNIHDARGWDDYWTGHLTVGAFEQGFSDAMSSDPALPELLVHRGAQSILCIGNGISMEAPSLGVLGFTVTALDISRVAANAISNVLRQPDHPLHGIPGFRVAEDGSVAFGLASQMDPARWAGLHYSAGHHRRDNGTLTFVTGDLSNPEICPGPFDVVIERRTVQLFPDAEQSPALARMAARLSGTGIFVSHEHSGAWRPGEDRGHYASAWVAANGFALCSGSDRAAWDAPSRLARLMFSTG